MATAWKDHLVMAGLFLQRVSEATVMTDTSTALGQRGRQVRIIWWSLKRLWERKRGEICLHHRRESSVSWIKREGDPYQPEKFETAGSHVFYLTQTCSFKVGACDQSGFLALLPLLSPQRKIWQKKLGVTSRAMASRLKFHMILSLDILLNFSFLLSRRNTSANSIESNKKMRGDITMDTKEIKGP